MENNFEKEMTELQIDMIDICNEYCEGLADTIYIYISYEGMLTACHFYKINNKIVRAAKLNDALPSKQTPFDVSDEFQEKVLDILMDDVEKIKKLCDFHKKKMPTEFRIVYDAKGEKMNAEYKYDKQFKKNMGILDIVDAWFDEEKEKNE